MSPASTQSENRQGVSRQGPRSSPRLRKPLYLDGPRLREVRMEGPALEVVDALGRHRYYPLARLSRIILRGGVDMRADVLPALLQAGLNLSLQAPDGALLGWLASSEPLLLTSLAQRLEELHALARLRVPLENWRRHQTRMMLLRHLAPHLPGGVNPRDLRARTLRNRANAIIHRRTGLDWRKTMRRFRAPLKALALQALQEAGIGGVWLGADSRRPDLAQALASLLAWILWGAALREGTAPAFRHWRDEMTFFERLGRRLEQEARILMDDLAKHLLDVPLDEGSGA